MAKKMAATQTATISTLEMKTPSILETTSTWTSLSLETRKVEHPFQAKGFRTLLGVADDGVARGDEALTLLESRDTRALIVAELDEVGLFTSKKQQIVLASKLPYVPAC